MAPFVGRHVLRIDKKGRVSVPKAFRDAFAAQGFAGIYAYPLFKDPALAACGEDFMTRLTDSIEDMDQFSDDQDDLASAILENAQPMPFDPEGRVVLPETLRAHARIRDEVLFVGRGRQLRLWDPATYEARNRELFDRLRARGATLKLRPRGGGEPA